ncbi:MAG: hypothetical protein LC098_06215 [Burkholderiales bacterium]|nr:hypothetical protein [Burkholderiales bacterium]
MKNYKKPSASYFLGMICAIFVFGFGIYRLHTTLQSVNTGDVREACKLCSTHFQRASQPGAFWREVLFHYLFSIVTTGFGLGLLRKVFNGREP